MDKNLGMAVLKMLANSLNLPDLIFSQLTRAKLRQVDETLFNDIESLQFLMVLVVQFKSEIFVSFFTAKELVISSICLLSLIT